MYLAMNRFQVKKDRAADFEAMWLGRDSELPSLKGFVEFRLLKGPEQEDHILYSSHTFWETEADFVGWTESDQFKRSHADKKAGKSEPMVLGHPTFEGFHTLQIIDKAGDRAA
jgi:heme-degrading monooxygenase HmoA